MPSRDEHLENSAAKFDGQSEAAAMVQRYQEAIKNAQEAQVRNETSNDCE